MTFYGWSEINFHKRSTSNGLDHWKLICVFFLNRMILVECTLAFLPSYRLPDSIQQSFRFTWSEIEAMWLNVVVLVRLNQTIDRNRFHYKLHILYISIRNVIDLERSVDFLILSYHIQLDCEYAIFSSSYFIF